MANATELKLEDGPKLKLEEGIPPPARTRAGSELIQLIDKAKPGQSVFVPSGYMGRVEEARLLTMSRNAASHVKKTHKDRVFTSAIVDGGARIWRLK